MDDIGLLTVDVGLWAICFVCILIKDGSDNFISKVVGAFIVSGIVFIPAMIILWIIGVIFQ